MEKVKVVKSVPGILQVGDILISPEIGADFCLEETEVTKSGSSERYVSLDYVTVSENMPQFFQFAIDEEEEISMPEPYITRSEDEIKSRYEFFKNRFESSPAGSEAQVVYRNLMWFIEWMNGKAEIY